MRRFTHGLAAASIALAVLGAFGFATMEASSVHTDDGCAVELHCFACRWSITSTAIVDAASPPLVPLEAIASLVPVPQHDDVEIRVLETSARGPPAFPQSTA